MSLKNISDWKGKIQHVLISMKPKFIGKKTTNKTSKKISFVYILKERK